MNRQIKFRAWDKVQDAMVNFDIYNVPPYVGQTHLEGEKFERKYELMQYTGLKDKNGTEIYEGDVVLDKYEEVKIVQWYEGQFVVTRQVLNGSGQRFEYNNINNHINHYSKFEVIGNIYENPELLERDGE